MEFEWRWIISLCEQVFLSWNSSLCHDSWSTMPQQWCECVSSGLKKSRSGQSNATSARDDTYLLRMVVTYHTASSQQLTVHWSIDTGASLSTPTICQLLVQSVMHARVPLSGFPSQKTIRALTHQHRHWHATSCFFKKYHFNLGHSDGCICIRCYTEECHLPEWVITHHSERTPSVIVWDIIGYHRRSQLLRIVGNINSN